jgi:branched-subunit amino acid aminotransferase/4-amino-4-deoxychorismate lyase
MPEGVDVRYDVPISEVHSSLRRAVFEAAQAEAENRGARVAVRVDSDGFLRSVDDAELFVVKEYTVMTPAQPMSVEGRLLAEAIRRVGLQLEIAPIALDVADDADEIFYADHRGITALGRFNGRPLMHILAEKIATVL